MYRSLLVPLDGSPFAEQALPLALSLAEKAGAVVKLARVHQPLVSVSGGDLAADVALDTIYRKDEADYLDLTLQRVRRASSVAVETVLLEGPVMEALHEHSLAAGAELVVMTTHGRGMLSRLWLGSVADKLMRRARVPLLLVRPHETTWDLSLRPTLQRIIIPLDGSPLAEQAVEPAIALGSLMGAQYLLVRVIEPIFVPDATVGGGVLGGMSPGLALQLQEEAQKYLDEFAQRLRERSLPVKTRVVPNRPPVGALLEEAKIHDCDLIAVATHGRGGLSRLVLGSVADKLVRASSIPVLVYHPTSS